MILVGKKKETPPSAEVAFEVKGSSNIGGETDEFCTVQISLLGDC